MTHTLPNYSTFLDKLHILIVFRSYLNCIVESFLIINQVQENVSWAAYLSPDSNQHYKTGKVKIKANLSQLTKSQAVPLVLQLHVFHLKSNSYNLQPGQFHSNSIYIFSILLSVVKGWVKLNCPAQEERTTNFISFCTTTYVYYLYISHRFYTNQGFRQKSQSLNKNL